MSAVFVGVNAGGAGKDVILAVSIANKTVDSTTVLSVPLFTGLWANCDLTPVIGGVSQSGATALFGTVDGKGAYTQKATVALPAGYALSGTLTATSPPSVTNDAFIATIYQPGDTTGPGFLWGE